MFSYMHSYCTRFNWLVKTHRVELLKFYICKHSMQKNQTIWLHAIAKKVLGMMTYKMGAALFILTQFKTHLVLLSWPQDCESTCFHKPKYIPFQRNRRGGLSLHYVSCNGTMIIFMLRWVQKTAMYKKWLQKKEKNNREA